LGPLSGDSLGDYLREQRQSARLSLRQLSEAAGISNPYLSQIERGLKKPSAEILKQLAKGLEVSAESLYVRAGILDEHHGHDAAPLDTRAVIGADPQLTDRQKAALIDIYDTFVGGSAAAPTPRTPRPRASSRTSTAQGSRPSTPATGAAAGAPRRASGAPQGAVRRLKSVSPTDPS
jgi:transcriptional regulator with XRE-family HTH domain